MGALKGSASYLRFVVSGDPPKRFAPRLEKSIGARRFVPLDGDQDLLESAGWAPIEAPFDDDMALTRERFWFSELLALSYREDKITLPRPVVLQQVAKKLAALEDRGEKITRQTKKSCELAVIAELRRRVMPRARVVDLVWDLPRGELRIFGRGPMVTERLVALFERTFGYTVQLGHYGHRAWTFDLSTRSQGVLSALGPDPIFEL